MKCRLGRRVEQETVAVGAGLVAAVGGDDEQRRQGVLQLLAHLGDGLAVAATAVIHRFPWEDEAHSVNQTSHSELEKNAHSPMRVYFLELAGLVGWRSYRQT